MRKKQKKSGKREVRKIILIFSLILVGLFGISAYLSTHAPCANKISCINDLSGEYQAQETAGVYEGAQVVAPVQYAVKIPSIRVLGDATASSKHIYIDLTTQTLMAFEGSTIVHSFPISSGKWGMTPTGDFKMWIKLRNTRMQGGDKAKGTYYNLPNVPYTIYFYNAAIPKTRGYGIHGAYWHNNFGRPMSHGCINLRPEDAGKLYYWADPSPVGNMTQITSDMTSTPITIYGQYQE